MRLRRRGGLALVCVADMGTVIRGADPLPYRGDVLGVRHHGDDSSGATRSRRRSSVVDLAAAVARARGSRWAASSSGRPTWSTASRWTDASRSGRGTRSVGHDCSGLRDSDPVRVGRRGARRARMRHGFALALTHSVRDDLERRAGLDERDLHELVRSMPIRSRTPAARPPRRGGVRPALHRCCFARV